MRNKDIEKNLIHAIDNSVPDVLDNILIKCEKKKGFKKNMANKIDKTKKEKNVFIPKLITSTAMVLILVLSVVGIARYNKNYKVDSIIEFDVNPSIEIKLNKDEKIIDIKALNDDAKKVIGDMDFKNVDIDVAVNAIIGSMLKYGYLTADSNSILVSVLNDDQNRGEELKNKISKEIQEILSTSKIDGSILIQDYELTDEIKKIAKENNISEGKAELIKRIIDSKLKDSKGNLYTIGSLSKLSINELNLLLNEKETILKNVNTTGNASNSSYIGKEKAKSLALTKAGLKENDVYDLLVELDADDGRLVYEVDFKTKEKEYEFEINAKTGEFIDSEIDYNDDYYEDINEQKNQNNNQTKPNTQTSYIGKDKAKSIALNDAKVKENSIYNLEIELDKEDNKYEIEFKTKEKEYSYDINAKTGKIIDKEIEINDRD